MTTRYWLRAGAASAVVGPVALDEIARRWRWGELAADTEAALDIGHAPGDPSSPPADGRWRPVDAVLRDPVFAPGTPERVLDERRAGYAWLDGLRRATHHRGFRAVVEVTTWGWVFTALFGVLLMGATSVVAGALWVCAGALGLAVLRALAVVACDVADALRRLEQLHDGSR